MRTGSEREEEDEADPIEDVETETVRTGTEREEDEADTDVGSGAIASELTTAVVVFAGSSLGGSPLKAV